MSAMAFTHVKVAVVQVTLDRFDLFHAHFFYSKEDKLGLLFHAAEFPAHCDAFPYFLGFCQQGSTLQYKEARMDFRNYMWYDVWTPVSACSRAQAPRVCQRALCLPRRPACS